MGYAIRVTSAAVEVVVGPDESQGLVAAESSGVKVGLRAKWAGNDLRSRGKMIRQGSGWVLDTAQSPGTPSMYSGDFSPSATPHSGSFPPPSPFLNGPYTPQPSQPGTPVPGSAFPRSPAPPPPRTPRMSTISHSRAGSVNLNVGPGGQTPSGLPLSPNPANGGGFPPPPSTPSALRTSMSGPPPSSPGKKDD
jgi:endoplasmic reticulum-Golgi intermediate compartment protein 2